MTTYEHDFEDLSIRVGGARVGLFYGTAELVPDSGGFYVRAIYLDGPQQVWLFDPRRVPDAPALDRELFNAISAVLYNPTTADGRHARDAFAAHMEEVRADAA